MYFVCNRRISQLLITLLTSFIISGSTATEDFIVPYPCSKTRPVKSDYITFNTPRIRSELTRKFEKQHECHTIMLNGKVEYLVPIHDDLVLGIRTAEESNAISVFLDLSESEFDVLGKSVGKSIELKLYLLSVVPTVSLDGSCITEQCKKLGLNGEFEKHELQLYGELEGYKISEE